MFTLRFKFQSGGDSLLPAAFDSILSDLVASHPLGFPVLRTQVYYPDGDLGIFPPNEFMVEVLDEDALSALQSFLQNRTNVNQNSILPWNSAEAMSPAQPGMWCYTYHAGHLRLTSASDPAPLSQTSLY